MLLALLFALAEFGVPLPAEYQEEPQIQTQAAPPAPASEHNADHAVPPPIPPPVEPPDKRSVIDYETGWVTYSDGTVRCITGALCEAEAGRDPSLYTYNWETEETTHSENTGDGWRID